MYASACLHYTQHGALSIRPASFSHIVHDNFQKSLKPGIRFTSLRVAHAVLFHYNNSMRKFLLCLIAAALLLAGCSNSVSTVSGEYYALDTICTQQVTGGDARAAADEVGIMLSRITQEMSMNEGSYLYAVNSAAPHGTDVSEETADLLETALTLAADTGGAFDPTIGPVSSLWDISGNPRVPSQDELAAAVSLVDYTGVTVGGTTVTLAQPGMIIDLGGIGKGFAADLAAQIYEKYRVQTALLNLGGNIYAYGANTDGIGYRIGLRDPYGAENDYFAIVSLKNTSVVTSGVYERYFESGGVTYHHLFDPETGYPVSNGLVAVTVVCESSTTADALSTALFVMGLNDGLEFAEALSGVEAAFITEGREVYVTQGLKGNIEITNESYILQS